MPTTYSRHWPQAARELIPSTETSTPGQKIRPVQPLSCQPPFQALGTFQGDVDTVPYHARRLLRSAVASELFCRGQHFQIWRRSTFGQAAFSREPAPVSVAWKAAHASL